MNDSDTTRDLTQDKVIQALNDKRVLPIDVFVLLSVAENPETPPSIAIKQTRVSKKSIEEAYDRMVGYGYIGDVFLNHSRNNKHSLPEDFVPTQESLDWSEKNGICWRVDLREETERFVSYHRRKGTQMVRPQEYWKNWMRNAVKYAKARDDGNLDWVGK